MAEQLQHIPEHHKHEQRERATHLEASDFEKMAEKGKELAEKQVEQIETARSAIEKSASRPQQHVEKPASRPHPTHRDKQVVFKQTLDRLQRQMPSTARTFSRVIHQPFIEKTSEVVGKTIFRPALTMGASLGALVGGTLVYLAARQYGFVLSGTEFLASGAIGGLFGLVAEIGRYLMRRLRGRSIPA